MTIWMEFSGTAPHSSSAMWKEHAGLQNSNAPKPSRWMERQDVQVFMQLFEMML